MSQQITMTVEDGFPLPDPVFSPWFNLNNNVFISFQFISSLFVEGKSNLLGCEP